MTTERDGSPVLTQHAALHESIAAMELLAKDFPVPASATSQSVVVDADAETVYESLRTADFSRSHAVRVLAAVRMFPDRVLRMVRRVPPRAKAGEWTIAGLIEAGYWTVLEDRPGEGLALGLAMWDARVESHGMTREMVERPGPGAVAVGWSFELDRLNPHQTLLTTRTRTRPADLQAERRFARYWAVISPFASLTRRLVLRRIADDAAAAMTSGHGHLPAARATGSAAA